MNERTIDYYKYAITKLWYCHHHKKYKSRLHHTVKITLASTYITSGRGLTELEAFKDAYKNLLQFRDNRDPRRNDHDRKYTLEGKISPYWQEELPL